MVDIDLDIDLGRAIHRLLFWIAFASLAEAMRRDDLARRRVDLYCARLLAERDRHDGRAS